MRTSILLSAACVIALLAGCSNRDNTRSNVLRIGNSAEIKGLDPHVVTGNIEYRILQALFEGLINLDQETLKPIPGVASSWTISEDGKRYIFHLNPDAKWSNGDPITANDFVYSFKRILSPELASQYAVHQLTQEVQHALTFIPSL